MAKGLTKRQEEILDYIVAYIEDEGYPPSIREIGTKFEIGSLRGVTVHLDALDKKGYISRSNTPRSIKVVHPAYQPNDRVAMVPLLGSIAAGVPIAAEQQIEDHLPVPRELLRGSKDAFLLRVRGDSMTGDGILPRDLVIIRPQKTASQNELVAFLMDGEATVKRFHRDAGGRVMLVASNPAYDPIEVRPETPSEVIGKVIGLLRDYEGLAF